MLITSPKRFIIVGVFICCIILLNCPPGPPGRVVYDPEKLPEIVPGYQWYSTPNDIEIPGTVFRVAPNGDTNLVTRIEIDTEKGICILPNAQVYTKVEYGILAKFLGLQKLNLIADADINKEKEVTVGIELEDTTCEKAFDDKIEEALMKRTFWLEAKMVQYKKERFFIIRECIWAKSMKLMFDENILGSQKIKAGLMKIVEGEQGVTWKVDAKFQLKYKYEKPLCVLYKIDKLYLSMVRAGSLIIQSSPVMKINYYLK